jgi:hypothetical protein
VSDPRPRRVVSADGSDKDIEIMVLRHQVRVLERQLHTRIRYRPADRAILAAFCRLLCRDRWQSFLVTPETLLRWYRKAANTSGAGGGSDVVPVDRR